MVFGFAIYLICFLAMTVLMEEHDGSEYDFD